MLPFSTSGRGCAIGGCRPPDDPASALIDARRRAMRTMVERQWVPAVLRCAEVMRCCSMWGRRGRYAVVERAESLPLRGTPAAAKRTASPAHRRQRSLAPARSGKPIHALASDPTTSSAAALLPWLAFRVMHQVLSWHGVPLPASSRRGLAGRMGPSLCCFARQRSWDFLHTLRRLAPA